jgi:hypothetical protein
MPDITDQLRAHAGWVDAAHRVPDPDTLRRRAATGAVLDIPGRSTPAGGRALRLLAAAAVVALLAGIGTYVRAGAGDPVSVGGTATPAPAADGLVPAGSLPAEQRATGSQAFDHRDPTWQFGAFLPEDGDRLVLTEDAAVAAARRGLPVVVEGARPTTAGVGHLYEVANGGGPRGQAQLAGDTLAWLLTFESPHRPSEYDAVCVPARQACAVDERSAGGLVDVVVDAATGAVLIVRSHTSPGG